MTLRLRLVRAALALPAVLLVCAGGCDDGRTTGVATVPARGKPGVRISMADLHRAGGVPPSWRLRVPPGDAAAGRRAFVDAGCGSCHRVAELPTSATDARLGPDLSGMGGHHPAEYFAEAILDPDAVLVEGPGYIGADGRSTMPSYPDLTLADLADLVAYLKSLRAGAGMEMTGAPQAVPPEVPAAPAGAGAVYWVQVYDVGRGRLDEFQQWFRTEGAAAFRAYEGVTSVDSWVDLGHGGPAVSTVVAFRDEAALRAFLADPATETLGAQFDEFVGPHQHRVFRQPPIYRAPSLSDDAATAAEAHPPSKAMDDTADAR